MAKASPQLHSLPTAQEAAQRAADLIVSLAERRVHDAGSFTIALSGGSTPRPLYQLLASAPYAGHIAWDRWQVFWGDERCVPPDHPESNYRMANEALLQQVPIPADRIHRIKTELPPVAAAQQYEQEVLRILKTTRPSFDLILLGIGEDGHTASLFPGSTALQEQRRLVAENWVARLSVYRVTFTLPLINAAEEVVFIVTEASKAPAVRQVLQVSAGSAILPAALVRPEHGRVHWFLSGVAHQLVGDKM